METRETWLIMQVIQKLNFEHKFQNTLFLCPEKKNVKKIAKGYFNFKWFSLFFMVIIPISQDRQKVDQWEAAETSKSINGMLSAQ